MRLLHWNTSGENLLSIDSNDSEIRELMDLGYHSDLSTSCHVYVYEPMYQYPWSMDQILFDRNEFVFKVISRGVLNKCTSHWHQLKHFTVVHFLSGKGRVGYTEPWETQPCFSALGGLNKWWGFLHKLRLSLSQFERLNLVILCESRAADKLREHMDKWSCPPWDMGNYMSGYSAGH